MYYPVPTNPYMDSTVRTICKKTTKKAHLEIYEIIDLNNLGYQLPLTKIMLV